MGPPDPSRRPPNYRAFGLAIRSDLAVPGAITLGPDDPGSADLEIVEGSAALTEPCAELGPYRLSGDRLLFSLPGVARYLCEGGRRILVERAAGAEDHQVVGGLIATALPALLWMRGEIVLHAAVAVLPGATRAVAIGGPSGSGKSTVLDRLLATGGVMVADDAACLRRDGRVWNASGLAAGYFLDDRHAARPAERQAPTAPLAALVILETPRGPPETRRLDGSRAVEALLASRHRPRVPQLLRSEASHLARFTQLAREIPVFRWSRREGALALCADEMDFLTAVSRWGESGGESNGEARV